MGHVPQGPGPHLAINNNITSPPGPYIALLNLQDPFTHIGLIQSSASLRRDIILILQIEKVQLRQDRVNCLKVAQQVLKTFIYLCLPLCVALKRI